MKTRYLVSIVTASLFAAMLSSSVVDAQGKKKSLTPEQEDVKKAEDQENYMKDLLTAYRLKELGMDKAAPAPEALVASARILRRLAGVPLAVLDVKPTIETEGGDKTDKTDDAPDLKLEAKELLAEARKQSTTLNLGLDKVIDDVEKEKSRGLIHGPRHIPRTIGHKDTQTFHMSFVSHSPATISFQCNLPIKVTVVRADNDNVIFSSVNTRGVANWMPGPPHGGKGNPGAPIHYTIRIRNMATTPAHYQLWTN